MEFFSICETGNTNRNRNSPKNRFALRHTIVHRRAFFIHLSEAK